MFDVIIAFIFIYEGSEYDPSGPSKYGITPFIYDGDIESLTKQEAYHIYRETFYEDWMVDLEPSIALVVFDTLVQHGEGKGTKLIQKAINDPEIKRDGILGPKTQQYLKEVHNTFIKRLLTLRYTQYEKNPKNQPKMRGLTSRLIQLAIDSQEITYVRDTEQYSRHDSELGRDGACHDRGCDCPDCHDTDDLG